jgi:hypothetical protein
MVYLSDDECLALRDHSQQRRRGRQVVPAAWSCRGGLDLISSAVALGHAVAYSHADADAHVHADADADADAHVHADALARLWQWL